MFILFDLDGTLLTDEKIILKEDVAHLKDLQARGHQLGIATGRRFFSVREILNPYDLKLSVIGNNGSIIRDERDRFIYKKALTKEKIEALLDLAEPYPIAPIFHIDGFFKAYDMIYHKDYVHRSLMDYLSEGRDRTLVKESFDFIDQESVLSLIYFGDDEDLAAYEKDLKAFFGEGLNTHILRNLDHHKSILEILDGEVNKYRGAQILLNHKGYTEDALITVGDDMNDLALIRHGRVSFAMKNGAEDLKKQANFVTEKDNNHGGAVASVLKYLEGVGQ